VDVGDRVEVTRDRTFSHLLPRWVRSGDRGTVISLDGLVVRVRFDGHVRDTIIRDFLLTTVDLIDKIAELSTKPPQQRIIPPGRTGPQ